MQEVPQPLSNLLSIQHQSQLAPNHFNNNSDFSQVITAFNLHNSQSINISLSPKKSFEESIHHQKPISSLLASPETLSDLTISSNTCNLCHKKFLKQAHLLRHINERHENNRSFICKEPLCGKTFKRDSHLRRHMISHTHEKSYKCTQCIMAFGYKHHLDRHIKSVHEKELLKCESCNLSFVKKKAFLKHFEKFHSNTEINKKSDKEKNKRFNENDIKGLEIQNRNQESKKTKKIKKKQVKKEKGKEIESECISEEKKGEIMNEKLKLIKSNLNNDVLINHFELLKIPTLCYENEEIFGEEGDPGNKEISVDDKNEMNKEKETLFLSDEKKNEEKLLFRCIHSDCVSAFSRMHELMRHLKQRHQQS